MWSEEFKQENVSENNSVITKLIPVYPVAPNQSIFLPVFLAWAPKQRSTATSNSKTSRMQ